MKRKCLAIGISTVSVILLILTSLTNVVGYQSVQSSNQSIIKERINQRELLFQTIVDITNNKDIQRIILKSQMISGKFFSPDAKLQTSITKKQLRQMYVIGLVLSKVVSKSKMQSIVGKYQFSNQKIQHEISVVIEKNPTFNAGVTQLQNSDCDCKNENTPLLWNFPVICMLLFPLYGLARLIEIGYTIYLPIVVMLFIGSIFNCFWAIGQTN